MDQAALMGEAFGFMVLHGWEGLTVAAVFYFAFALLGVRWIGKGVG